VARAELRRKSQNERPVRRELSLRPHGLSNSRARLS
jgi:hypothetical protein